MPKPSEPRPPAAFASLLATAEPVLLVGGQAVNLWALCYESRTAELAPFVSRDADVLGDRETLEALARVAGVKPQIFPLKPPSNEVGVVIAHDASGQPLLIEVLRHVHGVSNEELSEPAYTLALEGTKVRVPSPIALLHAKIANVADIPQAGREDARHVLILFRLIPAYLAELQSAAAEGRMTERKLINFLEQLLAVTTSKPARKVLPALRLGARDLFSGLGHPELPKLEAFLVQRLPRAFASVSPA